MIITPELIQLRDLLNRRATLQKELEELRQTIGIMAELCVDEDEIQFPDGSKIKRVKFQVPIAWKKVAERFIPADVLAKEQAKTRPQRVMYKLCQLRD